MTSTRERQQRAAARARLAREMAQRQEAAKRRRQRMLAISGAIAVLLAAGGTFLVVRAVTGDDSAPPVAAATPTPTAAAAAPPGPCAWTPSPATETTVDTGNPPAGEQREGTQTMTVTTNYGDIVVEMDLAQSPCIAASFTHLAGQEFYDGVYCHRMFPGMLQCGDPNARDAGYIDQQGIGSGGPAYQFADENLPTDVQPPYYPAGTMAMANSGPGTNGSQFFFIYQDMDLDGPNYSVVGQITGGIEVLQEIDAVGHDGAFDPNPGGGHPNEDVIIESLRVSEPSAPAPGEATPSAPPSPTSAPAPTEATPSEAAG